MMAESDKNRQEYKEQLHFMTLLADLSARFVQLPADQVDREIEEAMRRVCECLDLDLAALWQWEPDTPDIYVLTHLYRPIPGAPAPERMVASEACPWSKEQILAGRTFSISSMEDVPEGAEHDLESWRYFELKTNLSIPLAIGSERPFGGISFNDVRKEREWTPPLIQQLELVAQIFANALVRTRSEAAHRKSEMRLTMAAESAGAGFWSLNLDTSTFWATQKGRELFGFGSKEEITFESFMNLVHPEDREAITETIESIIQSGEEGIFEYRVTRADGSTCWMTSRGRIQNNLPGEAHSVLTGVTIDVTKHKQSEAALKQALLEVQNLRNQLANENTYLREQILHESGHRTIAGTSEPVRNILALAKKVASTHSAVLITGETGTGKELLAVAIHEMSDRKNRAMIKVNCAALPAALIESELFGREKGAYTGAMTQQVGRFEIANGSTLFLDEIGELPVELQSKLLNVLEDGRFQRLGSNRTITTDVRLIVATNRDLAAMVAEGSFREDLFHRLNVFPIETPPLRARVDDIPLLVWKFIDDLNTRMGKSVNSISKSVMEQLKQYPWPGNIRELRNVIERAMIVCEGRSLKVDLDSVSANPVASPSSTLAEVERAHILSVLEQTGWRISGSRGAAEILGLLPTTLHARLKKHGLSRPAR